MSPQRISHKFIAYLLLLSLSPLITTVPLLVKVRLLHHVCIMLRKRKKRSGASATWWKVLLGQQMKRYMIKDAVKLVCISFPEVPTKIEIVDDKNAKQIIENVRPINFPLRMAICTN